MLPELYFITTNTNKLEEAHKIFADKINLLNNKIKIIIPDIEETGLTYKENALQKLNNAKKFLNVDCFAEDSGLEVEALDNSPGIISSRYSTINNSSLSNVDFLMEQMEGKANRQARFIAIVALSLKGQTHFFEGIVKGKIALKKAANKGFGYDPIFIPEGYTETFSNLDSSVKQKISHRYVALTKLKNFLYNMPITDR